MKASHLGAPIHIVPASRYFRAGFEVCRFRLPSGNSAGLATVAGCARVWSYKSAELVDAPQRFFGDGERIAVERTQRLLAALALPIDRNARSRLEMLLTGYRALSRGAVRDAKAAFYRAAGRRWLAVRGPLANPSRVKAGSHYVDKV